MKKELFYCKTKKTVRKLAPWATEILKISNGRGFYAIGSQVDYQQHIIETKGDLYVQYQSN